MTACTHFTIGGPCCARGVNYLALAGGGPFLMVLRLPCIELSNRRGEVVRMCAQYEQTDEPVRAV